MDKTNTPVPESPASASLEENVAQVMASLPKPIRDFLQSPERDTVAVRIMQKYQLHTDVAGEFQRVYLFMLMGIFSPDQFVADLKEAGISEEVIRSIADDVNEQVFKPLREKEREEVTPKPATMPSAVSAAASIPAKPATSAVAVQIPPINRIQPGAPAPHNLPTNQSSVPVPGNLPPFPFAGKPNPATMPPEHLAEKKLAPPTQSTIPAPAKPTPFIPPAPSVPIHPESVTASVRTMQSDMLAAHDHRTPAPVEFHSTVHPEITPVMVPPPAPTPHMVPPVPAAPTPNAAPAPSSPAATIPTPPLPVDYHSGDPYREPLT